MASLTDTEVSRTQKDAPNNGLLSKITRSPSRKHKAQPSVPLPDSQFLGQSHSQSGSLSKRAYPRPGFQKAPTAPTGSVSLASIRLDLSGGAADDSPQSAVEGTMLSAPFGSNAPKSAPLTTSRAAGGFPTNTDPSGLFGGGSTSTIPQAPGAASGSQNPNTIFQHIHDLSNKRIATLDYMRKAHEGRINWFNTIQFAKSDISRLPSYTPNRLSRRATNYFLLGLSIPAVLDVHPQPHPQSAATVTASIAQDFLRSLNALLTEFEAFQQFHPPDGSTASSLSRARIPQMFKRATQTGNKPRRTSGAAGTEIGLPMQQMAGPSSGSTTYQHNSNPSIETINTTNTFSSSASTLVTPSPSTPMSTVTFSPSSSFPTSSPIDGHANSSLLPNEGPYTHLLTPPLPFAPDFYSVFATLCDVLIDAYQRLLQLISSPSVCTSSVAEMFTKADARLRKVIVGGIVREFEGAAREGARKELMGVQRVVLGGFIGS